MYPTRTLLSTHKNDGGRIQALTEENFLLDFVAEHKLTWKDGDMIGYSKKPKAAIWRNIWMMYSREVSVQWNPRRWRTVQV